MGPEKRDYIAQVYATIIIDHSSLKNQVRHQTRNQFLIFDDSTFLKWSHTLTLTWRGSAPVLVSELQVSSDRRNVVTSDQPQVSPVCCRDHGQRSSDDFTVRPIFGKRCNFVKKIAAGWAWVLICCCVHWRIFSNYHAKVQFIIESHMHQPFAVTDPGSLCCIQMIARVF